MADCCDDNACAMAALQGRQRRVLLVVLVINAAMFIIEISAGLLAHSTALLADSLDMLGDALVYGFSLYVIARGARWQAISAYIKGIIMALFAMFVFFEAAYKIITPTLPVASTIGSIAMLALVANGVCLLLLTRHRGDDINMHSVWLCSRNDIIANISVLFAAVGVWGLGSQWPDVLVGLGIALLFMRSSVQVLRGAHRQLQKTT